MQDKVLEAGYGDLRTSGAGIALLLKLLEIGFGESSMASRVPGGTFSADNRSQGSVTFTNPPRDCSSGVLHSVSTNFHRASTQLIQQDRSIAGPQQIDSTVDPCQPPLHYASWSTSTNALFPSLHYREISREASFANPMVPAIYPQGYGMFASPGPAATVPGFGPDNPYQVAGECPYFGSGFEQHSICASNNSSIASRVPGGVLSADNSQGAATSVNFSRDRSSGVLHSFGPQQIDSKVNPRQSHRRASWSTSSNALFLPHLSSRENSREASTVDFSTMVPGMLASPGAAPTLPGFTSSQLAERPSCGDMVDDGGGAWTTVARSRRRQENRGRHLRRPDGGFEPGDAAFPTPRDTLTWGSDPLPRPDTISAPGTVSPNSNDLSLTNLEEEGRNTRFTYSSHPSTRQEGLAERRTPEFARVEDVDEETPHHGGEDDQKAESGDLEDDRMCVDAVEVSDNLVYEANREDPASPFGRKESPWPSPYAFTLPQHSPWGDGYQQSPFLPPRQTIPIYIQHSPMWAYSQQNGGASSGGALTLQPHAPFELQQQFAFSSGPFGTFGAPHQTFGGSPHTFDTQPSQRSFGALIPPLFDQISTPPPQHSFGFTPNPSSQPGAHLRSHATRQPPEVDEYATLSSSGDYAVWSSWVRELISSSGYLSHISSAGDPDLSPSQMPSFPPPLVSPAISHTAAWDYEEWWIDDDAARWIIVSRLEPFILVSIPSTNVDTHAKATARDTWDFLYRTYGAGQDTATPSNRASVAATFPSPSTLSKHSSSSLSGSGNNQNRPSCETCDKQGHWARFCFQKGGAMEGRRDEAIHLSAKKARGAKERGRTGSGTSGGGTEPGVVATGVGATSGGVADAAPADGPGGRATRQAHLASAELCSTPQFNESPCYETAMLVSKGEMKLFPPGFEHLLDTGCTSHIFNDRGAFWDFEETITQDVMTANCGIVSTRGRGTVKLEIRGAGKDGSDLVLVMGRALYSPDAPCNLISVGTLQERGVGINYLPAPDGRTFIRFGSLTPWPGLSVEAGRCGKLSFVPAKIKLPPGVEVARSRPDSPSSVAAATLDGGAAQPEVPTGSDAEVARQVEGEVLPEVPAIEDGGGEVGAGVAMLAVKPPTPQRWHERLGHLGRDKTFRKGARAPIPNPGNRASKPLERIHMDTCGPHEVVSSSGPRRGRFKYWSSAAVLDAFKKATARWESQTGEGVGSVRMDGAKEFIGGAFVAYLDEQKVRVEDTRCGCDPIELASRSPVGMPWADPYYSITGIDEAGIRVQRATWLSV
ncbi:hypothetical protein D9611_009077 [Ephemerocybe angulata]|uniref:Retrovirus-related Pol polyprotein from transposon TNT 1-94-like beta-barrel domain-containing protein n=1 Tax=Ephemerocybe angulata TaxID=980116 RepID=A0A8H5CEK3_9AGAR|nr:hypothetical protein D9611_009077 [Tulosesus angulatus]